MIHSGDMLAISHPDDPDTCQTVGTTEADTQKTGKKNPSPTALFRISEKE